MLKVAIFMAMAPIVRAMPAKEKAGLSAGRESIYALRLRR
jgi:hypothetical protein